MRTAHIAAVGLAVLGWTADGAPAECVGTGCPYVKIAVSDGCVDLTNIGTDPITVRPSAAGVGVDTIPGRSKATPKGPNGQCLANYDFAYTAFLQASASTEGCTKVRNLAELGWHGEHKEKFCKAKGFSGATSFQKAGSRDYGGGFCYSGNSAICLKLMKGYPR